MKLSARFIGLQMEMQLKLQALSFLTFCIMLLQPIIFSIIGLILGGAYSKDPMQIISSVIGGGLMGIWGNVMYISAFDITSDHWNGVLEQIIGSPMDISQILRIRCLTNVLVGCISLGISFLIVTLLFDFRVTPVQATWLLAAIAATLAGFWCMGIVMAYINAATRKSKLLITAMEFPILALTGFLFPVELLPRWMQWIAVVIPVRWSGSALRDSLTMGSVDTRQMLTYLALTLLISGVYYLISIKLAVVVHDKIRINGEARYI